MTDVLLSWRRSVPESWGQRLRFRSTTKLFPLDWSPWHGVLARIELREERWRPAVDARAGLAIAVIGRLAWDAPDWRAAAKAAGDGGQAARLLLERWRAGLESFLPLLNGAGTVLVFEPGQRRLHLFTDLLGMVPIYLIGTRHPALCTHPDVLADWSAAQGQAATLDETTVAEGIAATAGVPPYTFYREIQGLDPATHYQFRWGEEEVRIEKRAYWTPSTAQREAPMAVWIERTAATLRQAVQRYTHGEAGKVGVFLSGGADSRVLLYAAERPQDLLTLTFADAPNPESAVAARIARLAGARNELLLRDFDHYGASAREAVRISGGYWSIKDNHFHGFLPALEGYSLDSILTGNCIEFLLKGMVLDTKPLVLANRTWPIYRMAPFDFEFYQPHIPIVRPWQRRVRERLETRYPPPIRSQQHLVEDLRIRPYTQDSDWLGLAWLRRMMPWDAPFTDRAIIELYDQMPPAQKLNGVAFRRALQRLANPLQRKIPDNNHGGPVDAGPVSIIAHILWRRLQGKARRFWWRWRGEPAETTLAMTGSWPDFARYVCTSRLIQTLWADPSPRTRECFSDILGVNPWARPMAAWAQNERELQLFLRLLAFKLWFDLRRY
jgi:asparagine synthase (glutamine-hydrolysing)